MCKIAIALHTPKKHHTHANRKFQQKWVRTRTTQLVTAHRKSSFEILWPSQNMYLSELYQIRATKILKNPIAALQPHIKSMDFPYVSLLSSYLSNLTGQYASVT